MNDELLKIVMVVQAPDGLPSPINRRGFFVIFFKELTLNFLSKAITFLHLYNIVAHIRATNIQFGSDPVLQKLKSTRPSSSTWFCRIALRVWGCLANLQASWMHTITNVKEKCRHFYKHYSTLTLMVPLWLYSSDILNLYAAHIEAMNIHIILHANVAWRYLATNTCLTPGYFCDSCGAD